MTASPGTLRMPSHGASVCVPVTNINDALLRGISMLNKAREEHTVPERSTSIIIMLTDGDANVGEEACMALAAAPGSIAGVLHDLGQLSPGSPVICEPLKGSVHPNVCSLRACSHDSASSAEAAVRSLQTELVQTVAGALAAV